MLNKVKGEMFQFLNDYPYHGANRGYTWNTILGRCTHNCSYCFNQGRPFFEGELRLNEKNFNDNLGKDNFIFVGSSNDLFQENIVSEWIIKTLEYCKKFDNQYLFQTKNPIRFLEFMNYFREMDCILGTTIETNRDIRAISKAPNILERINAMKILKKEIERFIMEGDYVEIKKM